MTPLTDILGAAMQLFSWMDVAGSSTALLALGLALVQSSKLSKLRKEHEQLRLEFDTFINEILQKSSTESEKKEL